MALASPHLPPPSLSPTPAAGSDSAGSDGATVSAPPKTVKYTLKVHNGVESLQPSLLDLQVIIEAK